MGDYTVKAVMTGDEWDLDVLGCPYGGPHGGKDAQGEYFDASTKFHEDKFGLPPAVYYHGFGGDGKPDQRAALHRAHAETLARWRGRMVPRATGQGQRGGGARVGSRQAGHGAGIVRGGVASGTHRAGRAYPALAGGRTEHL